MNRLDAQTFVDSHKELKTAVLFGITKLFREFGISMRALRFYEDKELLAPRRSNGARVYKRHDRARLSLTLRAKPLRTSLAEIKHAQIDATLAELRVINAACREHLAARSQSIP